MFNDAPATVAHVDLERYLGRWFEIARLPNRGQTEDCIDVTAEYTRSESGGLRLVQRCIEVGGDSRTDKGVLTPIDGSNTRLRLSFLPRALSWLPFTHSDYRILRLDPDYTMSLVGSRNRRLLWLLARSRHPDPAMRDDFLAHAERLGYDLTPLIHTPQDRDHDAQPVARGTRARAFSAARN